MIESTLGLGDGCPVLIHNGDIIRFSNNMQFATTGLQIDLLYAGGQVVALPCIAPGLSLDWTYNTGQTTTQMAAPIVATWYLHNDATCFGNLGIPGEIPAKGNVFVDQEYPVGRCSDEIHPGVPIPDDAMNATGPASSPYFQVCADSSGNVVICQGQDHWDEMSDEHPSSYSVECDGQTADCPNYHRTEDGSYDPYPQKHTEHSSESCN